MLFGVYLKQNVNGFEFYKEKKMSKAVGSIFGSGSTGTYGYENNYTNYLQNYNTQNYDNTLNNLTQNAYQMSQNLNSMPDYQFSVEGSDAARQRAEEATFESLAGKIVPQFQQQQSDLTTALANQGIPIGSEAYQRAFSSLVNSQNNALTDAAYQSVLNGQNAYSDSLNNAINAATFGNQAQQNYISQILSLLEDSVSGYQKNLDLYNIKNGIQTRQTTDENSGWKNLGTVTATVNNFKSLV